jgi:hypothetical protein
MPDDVTRALHKALTELESERQRLDQKITAVRAVLDSGFDGQTTTRARRGRRRRPTMSAAARRAVSERMKKYWAARRAEKAGKARAKAERPAARRAS